MSKSFSLFAILFAVGIWSPLRGASAEPPSLLAQDDVVWTSPSRNSSESMPCGGGDIEA